MLIESLKKLGITDISVLPQKTQDKITEFNQRTKSALGKDKEGNFTPNVQKKLDYLVEDVIFDAKLYLKQQSTKPPAEAAAPPVSKPNTNTPPPVQRQAQPPAPPVEKEGFLQNLLGF